MKIYVDEEPECESCPFYFKDINKAYQGEDVYRCFLKANVVIGQYGADNIAEEDVRDCPFELLPCADCSCKCPNCKCPDCG